MQLKKRITPTLQELAEVSNYKNSLVVKHYAEMSMQTALQCKSKSIGIISKNNEDGVKLAIANLFIGTSMYFDTELTFRKANLIAEELLAKYEYRQLKLEDILAICIELKESDIYKLTLARILRHISNYVVKREDLAIKTSIQSSEDAKAAIGESNIDERIKNSIRHIERSNKEVVKRRLNVRKFYK
jgi:hypothetical protein